MSSYSPGVSTLLRRGRLSLTDARRSDTGYYSCSGRNRFGRDSMTARLLVLEPPDPPVNVDVVEVPSVGHQDSGVSVSVSWSPAFDGNLPAIASLIDIRPDEEAQGEY